jgi:hypothetical protein
MHGGGPRQPARWAHRSPRTWRLRGGRSGHYYKQYKQAVGSSGDVLDISLMDSWRHIRTLFLRGSRKCELGSEKGFTQVQTIRRLITLRPVNAVFF